MDHAFSPEIFQRENRTTFLKFQLFPGTFQWNAWKRCVPLPSQPEFPEFLSIWKAPHVTFKRPNQGNLVPRVLSYPPYGAAGRREPCERGCNQGFKRVTYVPSLNFKTCCFTYWRGSLISLLLFFYCIFPFLCRCRSFNPSLYLLIPKLLQELDPRSRDIFLTLDSIWVGLTANTYFKTEKKKVSLFYFLYN